VEPAKAELVPVSSTAQAISSFERLARDPSIDVDKLDRLMQLQERLLARSAEELFNAAMTDAQQKMRPIAADASNPQTRSRYASYAQIDRALRPIYTEYGFGMSFDTADASIADHVRVLAYVTHRGGHSRTYKVDMPNDGKGAKGGDVMTKTHATGAAMSYGMRYLLKMIFNVAVGEDDRDGNEVKPKAQAPAKPAGYEDWADDMRAAAEDGGWPALSDAWKKSKEEYRKYATAHDKDRWSALREKATKVRA
jgi:hypothetical protein